MDDYRDELSADEYTALADAREVMREVIELVEELRGSAKKLGDAIAASGLPAREWVSPDAALVLLGEPFPDVSLDAFLTRLAEFAAGMGPAWLRSGEPEIARFNDEVQLLNDVARPLRVFAQRQRMLPVRERGELPLERAFGDGRVGTQLDLVAGYLRDLDALAPYIVPLTPSEWDVLMPAPPQAAMPQPAPQPASSGVAPGIIPTQQHWLLSSQQPPASPAYVPPKESASLVNGSQTYTRLRDFEPPRAAPGENMATPAQQEGGRSDNSRQTVLRVPNGRGMLALFRQHKWAVLGIAVLLLSAGTGLLSLAALHNASTQTSHLAATPTGLRMACTGKAATVTLTLRDTSKSPVTWTLTAPAALRVSATHGILQPGASVRLTATSTRHAATQGALTFAADDGTLSVPYVISCP